MFVRFRKLPCDGFQPFGVADDATRIACRHPWHGIPCRGHCRAKPRCRWRIGKDEQLVPYRLKVVLVENKRVNGKVKQETIAVLGSIEATLLPEFWDGIDVATKLKGEKWELQSLRARTDFWKGANRRLRQLANRLGPDTKRIRMAAHARVPYPMESGKKRLEMLEAMADYDEAQSGIKHGERMVASGQKAVKAAQEGLTASEKLLRWERLQGAEAANELAKLSSNR